MAQAQGSKRIYRNRDGADAVVWTVQPSASVVKKNADGSVGSDMRVTAYKTVGSTVTTYEWTSGTVLTGQPKPYYSIDGKAWAACGNLTIDEDGIKLIAYLGVKASVLATVTGNIRFKIMLNGVDLAFTPELPVVKDGADGASINIRGHVIGHGYDEGEYGAWRENDGITAEMRKKPFLVDNYGNSNVKTQVIYTPDGAMYGDMALYCETKENDAWVSDVDGHLWVWTADKWEDRGQFKGEPGENGSDGEKGDPGDPGADAVVWEVKASVGYLKVEKGYTFSRDIVVSGYKTVGEKKSTIDWMRYDEGEPTKSAQYRVDGGSWTACENLRQGVLLTGDVGLSASKLNTLKPKKYVQFRMVVGDTVVATTPEIQIVGDGLNVRGPQMWVNVEKDYQFYDRTLGNEWFDVVVHNNVFYSCKLSHTKIENSDGSYSPEPGNDGGEYWQATEKQEIVATYLLLAQRALIENLIVGEVQTLGSNGCYINIADGLVRVFGKPDSNGKQHTNIEFGVDESGMAVMKYFDNAGNLLYDLGPNGIRYISSTPEQWIEFALISVCGLSEDPVDDSYAIWATTGLPEQDNLETMFRYRSSRLNGVPNDTVNDDVVFYEKSLTSGKVDGWFTDSAALTDSDIYMQRANTNITWYLPAESDITSSNEAKLNSTMGSATKIYRRAMYKYIDGKIAAVQNFYFAV